MSETVQELDLTAISERYFAAWAARDPYATTSSLPTTSTTGSIRSSEVEQASA
jgi:hypothetical protein